MADDLRVRVIQTDAVLGAVSKNLEQHLKLIKENHEADLLLFPELSLTGYGLYDLVGDLALERESEEFRALASASLEGPDIVIGAVLEERDEMYNALLHFHQGKILSIHKKVHLPTYGMFEEGRDLASGDRFRSYMMPGRRGGKPWRVGMLICEDAWHLEGPLTYVRQGVDLILVASASPERGVLGGDGELTISRTYGALLGATAISTVSYVVWSNRVGCEDDISFWGGSRILDAEGAVLAGPAGEEEEVIEAVLDRGVLRGVRISNPLRKDLRRDVMDRDAEFCKRNER